jgi:outer membrane protein, multidrug efflux system
LAGKNIKRAQTNLLLPILRRDCDMKRATFYPESQGKSRAAVLGLALLALTACSLAPSYERPKAPAPASWPDGPAYQAEATQPAGKAVAEIPWREFFLDPHLQQTIGLALANNRDLRIATLNVERFRALYQIERAGLLPQLNASASGSVQRLPADLAGAGSQIRRQYNVGVGVSAYELDFFGRINSLKEQALEEYLATEEAQRAAQISLIGAVAQSYLTLAADREELLLVRQTLESRQASFALIEKRFNAGITSALDLQQAQTLVDAARVQSIRATQLVAQDENLLTLLVGAPLPGDILPSLLAAEITLLQELAPGLPSETLLRRPDIAQAEHRLKGANANIGAARAAFFPRITLTGSVGVGSDQLSGLFKSGSGAWSFAPQIILPIFDAGRNRANLKVSKVEQEIAVAQYEKAILTAFREVADALAERGNIDELIVAQQSLTAATAESARLSRVRYDKGADSYLSVLDAERNLFVAEQNLIAARLSRLSNLVTLYKVLGGGASE